jgi:putative membrane protein
MHEQHSIRHISAAIDLNRGMKLRLLTSALSIAALTLAVPACKKKESAPPATTGSATTGSADMAGSAGSADMAGSAMAGSADMAGSAGSAAGSAAAVTLTDPQIAAIVVAANQVDIDAGKLAAKKTKNAEVKKFAELMVKDHTAVNKSAVDLVTKLKVTPEETDTSKSLTAGGADSRAKLEKLEGAEFDKAYVDNEVAYHEAVINVLKTQLIPSAQNADLKAALTGVAPAFDAHLAHAKQVQESLAKGGSGAAAHDHK